MRRDGRDGSRVPPGMRVQGFAGRSSSMPVSVPRLVAGVTSRFWPVCIDIRYARFLISRPPIGGPLSACVLSCSHITVNLGDLADWLSAIGTVAAVVVALWLATRAESERLIVGISLADDKLEVHVSNAGIQPILIRKLQLQLGFWRPFDYKFLELVLVHAQRLPRRLAGGESTTIDIGINYNKSYLPDRLKTAWLQRSRVDRAAFFVLTTGQGRRIRQRVPHAVLAELIERAPAQGSID
jgi:hypothetical protein